MRAMWRNPELELCIEVDICDYYLEFEHKYISLIIYIIIIIIIIIKHL